MYISASLNVDFLDLDVCLEKKVLEHALGVVFGFFENASAKRFLDHHLSCFFSEGIFHSYFALGDNAELCSLELSGKFHSEDFRRSERNGDGSIAGYLNVSGTDIIDEISCAHYSFYIEREFGAEECAADDSVYADIRDKRCQFLLTFNRLGKCLGDGF